jgi:hypothetical protein
MFLVFLKFKSSPHDFNNLVIKSIMHAKYKNYFFYFSGMLNHTIFFVFLFFIKNANMIFLEELGNTQFKK